MRSRLGQSARGTPSSSPTPDDRGVSVRALMPLAERLRNEGIDPEPLFREAGAPTLAMVSPSTWIPRNIVSEIWRRAEERTDSTIGFRVAAGMNYRGLELLTIVTDFVVMQVFTTSNTVSEGLQQVGSWYGIAHGAATFRYDEDARGGLATLTFPPGDELSPAFVEFSLSMLACAIKQLSVDGVTPDEVCFTHAARRSRVQPSQHIGIPVRFDAERNAIVVSPNAASSRLRAANPALAARVRERAEEIARSFASELTITDRVRAHLMRELPSGDTSAASTAQRVGLSVRQLSRRLAEEGASHRGLLEAIRSELAERYLREEKLSPDQVSARLGYSDPSAMRRAARRWAAQGKGR